MIDGFVKSDPTQPYTSVMVGMIAAGFGLVFGLVTPIDW